MQSVPYNKNKKIVFNKYSMDEIFVLISINYFIKSLRVKMCILPIINIIYIYILNINNVILY